MTDALLTHSDREEALSRVYVAAVAAGAGYVTTTMDFDRDGVDLGIRAGGDFRPSLDAQLKATINLGKPSDGQFSFALKRRNYDLLRKPRMTPAVLILLDLPRTEANWLNVNPRRLILRRCAYWASLKGFPDSTNKDTVTIKIQARHRFDVKGLKVLMAQARTGDVG